MHRNISRGFNNRYISGIQLQYAPVLENRHSNFLEISEAESFPGGFIVEHGSGAEQNIRMYFVDPDSFF